MTNGGFTLEITFSGLCMFVPAKDRSRMHVLMPVTGRTLCAVDVHHHFNRLYYHPRSETSTGGPTNPPAEPLFLDLNGEALELRLGGAVETTLTPIVNLSTITGRKVRWELLAGKPADPVAARITMFAGRFGTPNAGLIWEIDGKEYELPSVIPWIIPNVPGDSIKFTLGGVSRTLRPCDGRLSIYMFNLPPDEAPDRVPLQPLPPWVCPVKGVEAAHFAAYYRLLDCPPGKKLPTFKRMKFEGQCIPATADPQTAAQPRAPRVAADIRGVRPVTCMLARADENGG